MYKQIKHTITASQAAGTTDILLELGFVPDRIVIRNRTNDFSFEWNDSMPSDEYYQFLADGAQTYEDTAVATFTVVDGSDKTNNVSTSFGIVITGNIANLSDAEEILDIYVYREDGV